MLERAGEGCEDSMKMGKIGYRPYWVLNVSLLVRAVHQFGAAVFLAAYLLDAFPEPPTLYVFIAFHSFRNCYG